MEQGFLTPPGRREVLLAPSCQAGGVRKRQHEGKGMQFPLFCSFPFPPASSSKYAFSPLKCHGQQLLLLLLPPKPSSTAGDSLSSHLCSEIRSNNLVLHRGLLDTWVLFVKGFCHTPHQQSCLSTNSIFTAIVVFRTPTCPWWQKKVAF